MAEYRKRGKAFETQKKEVAKQEEAKAAKNACRTPSAASRGGSGTLGE